MRKYIILLALIAVQVAFSQETLLKKATLDTLAVLNRHANGQRDTIEIASPATTKLRRYSVEMPDSAGRLARLQDTSIHLQRRIKNILDTAFYGQTNTPNTWAYAQTFSAGPIINSTQLTIQSSTDAMLNLSRGTMSNAAGFYHRTAGTLKWLVGMRSGGTNNYRWYNYVSGSDGMILDTLNNLAIAGSVTATGASSFGLNTKIDRTLQIKGASGSEYAYINFNTSDGTNLGYIGKGGGSSSDMQLYAGANSNTVIYGKGAIGLTIGASGAATFASNVILASTKQIGSDSAMPGIMGAGWLINQNATIPTQSYMEIDNIRVRNNFNTHYFTKDVVKVIGNKTFMTRSGLVYKEMSDRLLLNTSKSDQLADGDLIEYRDGQGTFVQATVSSHSYGTAFDTYYLSFTTGSYDDFNVGGTVAVVSGNSILLDGNTPTIDLFGGVSSFADLASSNKVKVRLGNLGGMTFGGQTIPANTYGLMTTNGYFKGEVLADSGVIGGWKTNSVSLTKSGGAGAYAGMRAPNSASDVVFFAGATDATGQSAPFRVTAAGQVYATSINLSGYIPDGGAADDINYGSTTINGNQITTGTITLNQLNFTPVQSSNIIASINASAEGLAISGSRITIDGTTQFQNGYNPHSKIEQGGAAADINNNTTTIDGGKITTGSITANQIATSGLSASAITTGTMSADRITGGSIGAGDLTISNGSFYVYTPGFSGYATITGGGMYLSGGKSFDATAYNHIPSSWGSISDVTYDAFPFTLHWRTLTIDGTTVQVLCRD